MKTVTFEVCSPKQAMAAITRHLVAGTPAPSARIVFASKDLLSQIMTEERWRILKTLCRPDAMPVKVIAEVLGQDLEEVNMDIKVLLNAGILERHRNGNIIFPYDEVFLDLPTKGRTTV